MVQCYNRGRGLTTTGQTEPECVYVCVCVGLDGPEEKQTCNMAYLDPLCFGTEIQYMLSLNAVWLMCRIAC